MFNRSAHVHKEKTKEGTTPLESLRQPSVNSRRQGASARTRRDTQREQDKKSPFCLSTRHVTVMADFGQTDFGQSDFGQSDFGQTDFDLCLCVFVCVCVCVCVCCVCWFHGFRVGVSRFWFGHVRCPRDRPSRTALPGTALPGTALPGTAQNLLFFFPLPPQNSFCSSLSGCILVEFWWCF